uniref:G-protein coupled receptors family 1 profile domain-containing protein n=1 Tax=Onchocerca volvulus TaxID=6282 RepID=A0A8R1TN39_ONCVO
MVSNTTFDDDWHNKPLNSDDIIAGGTLILLALIFLLIYILVALVLYRESRTITGFVYLLSASINNMILLVNYALLPGILIIAKKRTPENGRRLYQIYSDAMWFSMCYHTLLVAWTRYAAICRPVQFRKLKISTIYISCSMCYVIAFVQSTIAYFQPWYVTFYYEASVYGIVAEDIKLYLEGGKAQLFFIFHLLIFIGTFFFYGLDNI